MRERREGSSRAVSGDPARGALQVGRAVVFAVACAALGLGGHLAGGGGLPPGLVLGSLFAGLLATGAFLARRQLGKVTGMVCAGAAQFVQHTVFAASAGLGSTAAGPVAHGHEPLSATMASGTPPALPIDGPAHPEAMTVAHVVAGLGLGILLAQLDSIVWRLLEPFRRPLVLMSPAAVAVTSRGCQFWWIEQPVSRPASGRPPCRGPPRPRSARCHSPF